MYLASLSVGETLNCHQHLKGETSPSCGDQRYSLYVGLTKYVIISVRWCDKTNNLWQDFFFVPAKTFIFLCFLATYCTSYRDQVVFVSVLLWILAGSFIIFYFTMQRFLNMILDSIFLLMTSGAKDTWWYRSLFKQDGRWLMLCTWNCMLLNLVWHVTAFCANPDRSR